MTDIFCFLLSFRCLLAEEFHERIFKTMAKNSTKKMADDVKKETSAATGVKAAPTVKEVKEIKPAAEVKAVKEVKADAPAKVAKPATEKAPKTAKPAAKTKAAPKATKSAPAKTAKTAAAKPAAEPAKAAPKKKSSRKPKAVEIGDICAKLYKKVDKNKAAKIKDLIAADVEIWGWEDGTNKHLFVEVLDGSVRVEPYDYVDCTLRAHISFADAIAFLDGKLSLADALSAGKLNANGNVAAAIKLAEIL